MRSNSHSTSNFVEKGIIEILGEAQWKKICLKLNGKNNNRPQLSSEKKYPELGKLIDEIGEVFGEAVGFGIAQRAGSASFKYFQTEFSQQLNFTSLEMLTKPLRSRLREGLISIADCLNREFGIRASFEEIKDEWRWRVIGCSECSRRESEEKICYFTVGLIQEFLSWSAGSKFFQVEEIACSARGDPQCEFTIGITPVD